MSDENETLDLSQACDLIETGQLREAVALLEPVLTANPDSAPATVALGEAWFKLGDGAKAKASFERAYQLDPSLGAACFWFGVYHEKTGQRPRAIELYHEAVNSPSPHRQAYIQLASHYHENRQPYRSLEIMMESEEQFPDDKELRLVRGQLASRIAPLWHLPMLADHERNAAYEAAIKAKVAPNDIVLDIGTGSGLLAMMAARAGAKHVYACEAHPILAEMAKTIIADNGYSEQITVIAKQSTDISLSLIHI